MISWPLRFPQELPTTLRCTDCHLNVLLAPKCGNGPPNMPTAPKCTDCCQIYLGDNLLKARHLYLPLTCKMYSLFKSKLPHIEELKNIREPPDHTWNELMPVIHIRDLGKTWKMTNMLFVMNMSIMKQFHQLRTELEDKKPIIST